MGQTKLLKTYSKETNLCHRESLQTARCRSQSEVVWNKKIDQENKSVGNRKRSKSECHIEKPVINFVRLVTAPT